MFDHLFSPIVFGKVTLPNRICFLAHRTNFARKGRLDARHMAYYRRRAEGGCGLIIVGELSIHPYNRPWEAMIEAYGSHAKEDFQRFTQAMHACDTPVFAQLNHHGFQSSGAITRHSIWGPSAISDIVFGETAKPMEPEDMAVVVGAFADAAVLAREGGFDGLEIDMGPESLLRQFLSPLSNQRQDEYGGNLENRMRFPLDVLKAVRKKVGDDFTVGIRLCADEKFWGAITTEESCEMSRIFEGAGRVHFINVAVGTYYNLHLFMPSMHTPFGFTIETAEQIKSAVTIPVIASNQIDTPRMGEDILQNGQGDAIGLIRNLICDPDWPKKALEGRIDDIRYCVRDNQGCIGRINQSKMLSCIQNPQVGYEEGPSHKAQGARENREPSQIRKRVLVVGAGPAGLAAAQAARKKGHDVTVYEKGAVVGGQINLARKGAGRQRMGEIIHYLSHVLKELEVPILTGVEVTREIVLEKIPDAVIVATGSTPVPRPVPGEYGPPLVQSVWDILEENFPVGERVLFIDENGGHHAAATVEMLADQGKQVDMITSDLFIGIELAPLGDLYLTRQRLLQKGVTFTTDVVVQGIDGSKVEAKGKYTNEPLLYEGYDTIVLDMGNRADDLLYCQLKGEIEAVYRAGDCVSPRGIDMAIFEGRKVGERL
ncbi:MAG: FAD-dependent oxidoreductase [Deltaproteobacteria bacterium]|nr:FAD-dependent oxidoreductase [Deltaproteobacteria bacterium]